MGVLDRLAVFRATYRLKLGRSLAMSPLGSQADNIEEAIKNYNKALKVYKQEAFPEQWAGTLNDLAGAYILRIEGDRADSIEQAIKNYEKTLMIFTQDAFPVDWAMSHNNLAISYIHRIVGDQEDNIEQAIEHCSQALKVRTQDAFPADWAMTRNNLAVAYVDRMKGDRADNIEQAIEHYSKALEVRTQKALPKDWAETQINIANAYRSRIMGDRADNIEQAIHHLNQALEVFKQDTFPDLWARTLINLAAVYRNRIRGDQADNIEQAIKYNNKALDVFTQETFPDLWARTLNNLADACIFRIKGDRAGSIEQAIEHCSQALEVRTQEALPKDWADTQHNLATAYFHRIKGERGHNIEQAMKHCNKALTIYNPKIYPNECRRAAQNLGFLYLEIQRWKEAADNYTLAAVSAERLYQSALSLSSKEAELAEMGEIYRHAAYSRAKSDQTENAVVLLEQGRGRGLGDALARDRADLERVRQIDPTAYALYSRAVQDLQQLESKERAGASGEEKALPPRDLMMQARAGLDNAVDRIRRIPGYESFLKETGWEEIAAAVVEGQPLVYIAAAPRGGVALIVHRSPGDASVDAVNLDSFSEERLQEHLKAWFDAYGGWQEGRQKLIEDKIDVEEYLLAQKKWFDSIESVTGSLWQEVMEPVYAALQSLKPSPLPNSHAEVLAISSLFQNPEILEHEKATRSDVLQALPAAQVAHFSCHGGANWSDPEQSGLLMANGEMLTVNDLFELHLTGARLASLSACETGVPGTRLPDEVVSLPSAFIRAGFAGAIGSLWTVPEKSTAQLMTSFYQFWRVKGMPPVQALAEAQKELRKQEKFQHPFYWAAFYMTGV